MLRIRYFLISAGALAVMGLIFITVAFSADDWAELEFPTKPDYTMENLGGTLAGIEYPKNSSYCRSEHDCGRLSLGMWSIEICATFPVVKNNIRPSNIKYFWPKKPRALLYACEKISYTEREITHPEDSSWDEKKPFKQMFKYIEVSVKEFGLLPEFQVSASIGLIAACFGLIFSFFYIRSGATNPTMGSLGCFNLLIAGILNWDIITKIVTILRTLKGLTIILKMAPVRMPTAWCLIVGGIGATFEILSGSIIFVILIMNIKKKEATWCCFDAEPKDLFAKRAKLRKGEIKPQNRETKQEKHQTQIHGTKKI